MSIQSILFNIGAGRSDRKRDKQIPLPTGVTQLCNLSYGPHGKWNRMDIYFPDGAKKLPVIINIHGGGFVYGNKEIYKRYCMDLARRGFTVMNINYRLAPFWKFPAPLEDIHNAVIWLMEQGEKYHADTESIFMVGDSAGAQLASQYAAMVTNPDYTALFRFKNPAPGSIKIQALGLNCGVYDLKAMASGQRRGIELDYFGRKLSPEDPRLEVLDAITAAFPPAHITTACHDFLRDAAKPMALLLTSKGIPCQMDVFGSEADTHIGHVFHVNILQPEAMRCNDTQCAFFRQFIR